jgi:hypothetical protein
MDGLSIESRYIVGVLSSSETAEMMADRWPIEPKAGPYGEAKTGPNPTNPLPASFARPILTLAAEISGSIHFATSQRGLGNIRDRQDRWAIGTAALPRQNHQDKVSNRKT